MHKQICEESNQSLNSILSILNEIYHTISSAENTQKNESVESLLSDLNCIYYGITFDEDRSNQTLVSNGTKMINQYYIDLITKAILKNNIICTQTLITQVPNCCCLEFSYPSIETPEIGITINGKAYSINIIDAKITDQFLFDFFDLLQTKRTEISTKSPSVLDNGLLSKYMTQWLSLNQSSELIARTAINKDRSTQTEPDRANNEFDQKKSSQTQIVYSAKQI